MMRFTRMSRRYCGASTDFKQVLPTMNGVCTYLDAFKSADMAEEWGDVDVVPETRRMLCKAAAMAGVESSENEDEYERASMDDRTSCCLA
jgi:hypothetical protein